MSCCWLCGIGGAAATCLLSIRTTMPRIVLPLPVAFCWRFSCRWVLAPVCPKDGHRRQQYDFRSGATCAAAYFRSLVRRHVRPAVHSIRCSIKLKHIKLITFGSIRRCRLTHIHCICCILQSYNNYIINCSHLMESPREYTLHSGTVWIMSLLFSVVCAGVIILSRKTCLAIRLEFFFFSWGGCSTIIFLSVRSLGEQCHLGNSVTWQDWFW